MRTKKLENFVQKHLKLSVKVAESLNTKQFVQQSMFKGEADDSKINDTSVVLDDGQKQIKMYDSGDEKSENKSDLAEKQVEIAQTFQPTGTTLD